MKKLIYSVLAIVATAGSCLAQTSLTNLQVITVTLQPGATAQCVFQAQAFSQNFDLSAADGVQVLPFVPITITRYEGLCSGPLIVAMFKSMTSVTIVLNGKAGAPADLKYTLSNVTVVSVEDDSSVSDPLLPLEKIVLSYQTIKIEDLVDNTSITCSVNSRCA